MTNALKITFAVSLAALSTLLASTPAAAVDFDCRVAGQPAERAICSDARLSRLDEAMARVYGRLWSVSGTRERLGLREAQLRFLAARNDCRWNVGCIHDTYLDQISVLDAKLVEKVER